VAVVDKRLGRDVSTKHNCRKYLSALLCAESTLICVRAYTLLKHIA
jgi:hypothetical protein